jgi:hypothetical protein
MTGNAEALPMSLQPQQENAVLASNIGRQELSVSK